jgi:transposase
MTPVYLGIDVAKKDFCLATSTKSLKVLANTPEGFQALIQLLTKWEAPHVILEASGGYERNLTEALQDADIRVSVVQPGCVRHFAKSLKVLAKTDAIDATVIARFGEATQPDPTEKTSPVTRRLRALADRRTQLVEDRVREKNRLETCPESSIAKEIARHIKHLSTVIEKIDQHIKTLIDHEQELSAKAAALQTATGVGTQTACSLLAHLPELGTLSRQAAAAIAGLAPHPQESGKWVGKRRIYGGRKAVRKALYMAAKSAAQHCPHLAPFYQKLRAANKPYNVALIAVARKLLVRLNTILKNLKSQPPAATLST